MASTPIYNWPTPDNTDLVKNGALAIRTLGDAIDTTVDTMIPETIFAAKGDLLGASANDTPAVLTVGNNGETLVADSSTSTGLRYQVPVNTNPVLNSAMQIWQRGTSLGTAGSAYIADRWNFYRAAFASGITVSRQATNDTTNLPFIQYCSRVQRDSGNANTGNLQYQQSFETVNSISYAGKTVTLSFYARAGANYSPTSSLLVVQLFTGTGTDEILRNGFTGVQSPINTSATLTTTWQRFTYTATLATNITQIGLSFLSNPTGTAGANDYFELTGVQLENGSVATPFKTYAGTIQGELAACQRYYYRLTYAASANREGSGGNISTTQSNVNFAFPVTMRRVPTALEQSGTAGDYSISSAGVNTACSAVPTFSFATQSSATPGFTVASGLVAGNSAIFRNVNTNAFFGWSAEL
jgi:hypothetical protein